MQFLILTEQIPVTDFFLTATEVNDFPCYSHSVGLKSKPLKLEHIVWQNICTSAEFLFTFKAKICGVRVIALKHHEQPFKIFIWLPNR